MAGTNHVSAGTQPAAFKRWLKLLDETRMLYLFAMSGYGKTTQARAFAAACYKEWAYLSAAQEDFERQLRAFMSAHGRPRVKTLLILDDLQWVKEESSRQSLFDTLLEARHVKGLQLLCSAARRFRPTWCRSRLRGRWRRRIAGRRPATWRRCGR